MSDHHKRFCHDYADHGNAAATHEATMQTETARSQGHTTDELIGKLEVVFQRALDEHDFAAATRAVDLQARLAAGRRTPLPRALRSASAACNENHPRTVDGRREGR